MTSAETIGIVYMAIGLLFMLAARYTLKDAQRLLRETAEMLGIDLGKK